jgi:hypothetical protein
LPLVVADGFSAEAGIHPATGSLILPTITATGSGKLTRKGSGVGTLPLLDADGTGTITEAEEILGSGSPILRQLVVAGAGKKIRKGTGALALPLLELEGGAGEPVPITSTGLEDGSGAYGLSDDGVTYGMIDGSPTYGLEE